MKTIFHDLELSQVRGRQEQIIQIGAVLVATSSHKILKTFNVICRPEDPADRVEGLGYIKGKRPGIETITDLTGITAEQVENGVPLKEALEMYWKWVTEVCSVKTIYEWGAGDQKALETASRDRQVKVPRLTILNVKEMGKHFRKAKNMKAKGGLEPTMKAFGLKFVGRQHDALDDAFNTALLFFQFEEYINIACNLEKSYGTIKVLNKDETIDKFLKMKREDNHEEGS